MQPLETAPEKQTLHCIYNMAGVEFGSVLRLKLANEPPVPNHRLAQRHVEVARHLTRGDEGKFGKGWKVRILESCEARQKVTV